MHRLEEGRVERLPADQQPVRHHRGRHVGQQVRVRRGAELAAGRRPAQHRAQPRDPRLDQPVADRRRQLGRVGSVGHQSFVVAGGNPVLLDFYDKLRARQVLLTARRAASGPNAERILRDRRHLAELVEQGDIETLDGALRDHLATAELSPQD